MTVATKDGFYCSREGFLVNSFDSTAYGSVFAPLLDVDRRRPLDAGSPNSSARGQLKALTIESAFAHIGQASNSRPQLADTDMAACCLAGIWLLHDFLAESHTISQNIDTTSGSFWHGIMHRREGDFSNAKYWFRHVGQHPVFDLMAEKIEAAGDVYDGGVGCQVSGVRTPTADTRNLTPAHWDPFAFVDACQAALRNQSADRDRCLDLQQLEWETLFDYCYRAALGDRNA